MILYGSDSYSLQHYKADYKDNKTNVSKIKILQRLVELKKENNGKLDKDKISKKYNHNAKVVNRFYKDYKSKRITRVGVDDRENGLRQYIAFLRFKKKLPDQILKVFDVESNLIISINSKDDHEKEVESTLNLVALNVLNRYINGDLPEDKVEINLENIKKAMPYMNDMEATMLLSYTSRIKLLPNLEYEYYMLHSIIIHITNKLNNIEMFPAAHDFTPEDLKAMFIQLASINLQEVYRFIETIYWLYTNIYIY